MYKQIDNIKYGNEKLSWHNHLTEIDDIGLPRVTFNLVNFHVKSKIIISIHIIVVFIQIFLNIYEGFKHASIVFDNFW